MKRQIIAVDIDDVLAAGTESLRLLVNQRLGVNLTREHYSIAGEYWGYYERVWNMHGLAEKVSMPELNQEMVRDQSHVPLLPDASFAISELSKRFDIAVVTARDAAWEEATLAWLRRNFGDVFIGVHFAGNRRDARARTKGQLCREVGAFLLIDDNIDHCRSAVAEGLEAILFGDYGWHQDVPDDITRCKNWPQVLEFIDERG